jgi:hypothetical protein
MATPNQLDGRWHSAWPDAVAFVTVLAVAWWLRASATDLVWSLWLSSLVVGYAIILWSIFRPVLTVAAYAWRDRTLVEQTLAKDPRSAMLVGGIGLVGGLFLVAFFTVHFGGFHYVHAQFLSSFFPLSPDYGGARPLGGMALFDEALRRYWVFLPSAFLAERAAFRPPRAAAAAAQPADVSVTARAIAARKAANQLKPAMMSPYVKVMRMHVLIFFFAFAHFARLDNFAVYAVVYAVYFFPWRLVARPTSAAQTTPA